MKSPALGSVGAAKGKSGGGGHKRNSSEYSGDWAQWLSFCLLAVLEVPGVQWRVEEVRKVNMKGDVDICDDLRFWSWYGYWNGYGLMNMAALSVYQNTRTDLCIDSPVPTSTIILTSRPQLWSPPHWKTDFKIQYLCAVLHEQAGYINMEILCLRGAV